MFPLEEDMPIKPAETLAEMLALWDRPILPRSQRKMANPLLVANNIVSVEGSAKYLATMQTRKLDEDELPSDEKLEALKDSVGRDEIICSFIPSHKELGRIHREGFGLREGHDSLHYIVWATLRDRMTQKYDLKVPLYKEDRVLPDNYLDENSFWHSVLEDRFNATMPEGWTKTSV
jgi:hypothetical protein